MREDMKAGILFGTEGLGRNREGDNGYVYTYILKV